jgi:hypothetical protein
MPIAAAVGDANVLLSAVVGKAALRVVTELGLEVHVTCFNAAEVEEYLPVMAAKYRLPRELVLLQWRILPVCSTRSPGNGTSSPVLDATSSAATRTTPTRWPWPVRTACQCGPTTATSPGHLTTSLRRRPICPP